jgi:zinc D-Ala-D-Ala carboxypeptidase
MTQYFADYELACKCGCGELKFDPEFRLIIESIRSVCGFALPVSSGYRCENHPAEASKEKPGSHSRGVAVDFAVSHDRAFKVIQVALDHGIRRIGVNQKGSGRFIHIDVDVTLPAPAIWSY